MTKVLKLCKPPKIHHGWDMPTEQALELQIKLGALVLRRNRLERVRTIAGIDAYYWDGKVRAAVAVLSFPGLDLIEHSTAVCKVTFPYVPGFFSFRETPSVLRALRRLETLPDIMLVDGHGVAHPRRFGIASHIGLLTGIPSIGCAKTLFIGSFHEPANRRGAYSFLIDQEEIVGAVLRTKYNVKPMFISIGHMVDLSAAVSYTLKSCRGHRVPEPLRLAHHLAKQAQLFKQG